MARGATITVENSFNKGLITEFPPMSFPENAVTDADNVVFSELGVVTRRLGIDYESDNTIHAMSSLTTNPGAFIEYHWVSANNNGLISFVVQQIGDKIFFFEIGSDPLSGSKKSFSVNLLTYKTPGTTDGQVSEHPCQFTSGKGFLFVAHPFCEPLSVEYDSDTDTITTSEIQILVRDFERLDDGLEIDERPTTLTDLHKYNLYNQGWYFDAVVRDDGVTGANNVLTAWDYARSDFPANSDIWWVYKNSEEVANFSPNAGSSYIGPDKVTLGNTPAPNGHYIYEAWDIDRTAKTGISGLPSLSSSQARPSTIAFFAGRVFYSGVSANKYSDKVYFSQIIESDDQFGKCYQANDPTSETTFDLLSSDGGVISIPTIGKIVSIKNLSDSLIVLGTNGIFVIRGSDNGPFVANDYTVEYVSSIGCVSDTSIVRVDSNLLWWNYDSLLSLTRDNIGVSFQVQNVSKQTIQSVIDSVPAVNKPYIKGAYNKRAQVVQWLYADEESADPWTYNRILELNVASQAFSTHTVVTSLAPRISGILTISGERRRSDLEDVTDNALAQVTNNALQDVQIEAVTFLPNSEIFKYAVSGLISSGSSGFTYAEQVLDHQDWGQLTPTDFTSYFYSGYRMRGEMLRSFNSTPIAVVVKNVVNGEVVFKGVWDYGFKSSMPQEIYAPIDTYYTSRGWSKGDYLVRRLKVRGKGKSLQLYFYSEGSAPFEIVGWSTFDTGGQQP